MHYKKKEELGKSFSLLSLHMKARKKTAGERMGASENLELLKRKGPGIYQNQRKITEDD